MEKKTDWASTRPEIRDDGIDDLFFFIYIMEM